MRAAFIVACSAGKSIPAEVDIYDFAPLTPAGWADALSRQPLVKAKDLYTGESFRNFRLLLETTEYDPWVFSAGLGFVHFDKLVPSYEASFSNEVADKVYDRARMSRDEWVRKLIVATGNHFVGEFDRVICALPDAYEDSAVNILGDEIILITARTCFKNALVFDRRLNDPNCPYRGRDVDYKFRMVKCVIEQGITDQAGVEAYLSQFEERKRAVRPSISDAELVAWLERGTYRSFGAAHQSFLDAGIAMGKRRLEKFWGNK